MKYILAPAIFPAIMLLLLACSPGNADLHPGGKIPPGRKGDYLGQPLPGDSATLFAPGIISTGMANLAEMQTTFGQIDENFAEWEQGRATDESIFRNPQLAGRQPPRPYRPPDGGLPEPPRVVFDPNRVFAALVEEFIREYALDMGQITTARSILEEFKGRANNYRDSKKRELGEFDARQRQALKDRNLPEVKKVVAERKALLKPVYDLCAEMDARLKSLLTTEQIQRHAERSSPRKEETKTTTAQKEPSSTKKPAEPKTEPAEKNAAKSESGTDTGK